MAININMSRFQANVLDEFHNVAERGDIDTVIHNIGIQAGAQVTQQVMAYFDCLGQLFEMPSEGLLFRGKCISRLKCAIFDSVRLSRARTITVNCANNDSFKENIHLKPVIEKVNYMAKGRFFSDYNHYFIRNTRFSHHLSKIFGNPESSSTSSGMTLVVTAATACIGGGITQWFTLKGSGRFVGIPLIGFGATIIAGTVVSAISAARREKP